MKKTYLILSGGLGNQMFMFASAYALTRRWGHELVLLDYWFNKTKQRGEKFTDFTRYYELDKFVGIQTKFVKPDPLNQAVIYQLVRLLLKLKLQRIFGFHFDKKHLTVDKRFDQELILNPARVLMGYYQSHYYFQDFRNDLIPLFELPIDIEKQIAQKMDDQRSRVGRLVMVHVRREDSLVPGNNWTGILTPNYFEDARKRLDASPEQLVIFSDDPKWCQNQSEFKRSWIVNEPDPVRTLRMMTYCDDHIIAGSTLSWWGAWLSNSPNKKVIAPIPFYLELSTKLEKSYIPESWFRLPANFGI